MDFAGEQQQAEGLCCFPFFFSLDFETRQTHEQMLIDPFWSFLAFEEILDLLFQSVFMPLILLNYSSQFSVW